MLRPSVCVGRDHDVVALVGRLEDARERVVDRVGEDVGAGHQRHAERDRDRRQQHPQLALHEAAQHQREHQPTDFIRSSACSARGRLAVVHDPPVGEHQQAVGERGGVRVVGDHHDRLVEVVDGVAQQFEHVVGGLRVEVAGRLVGEHDRRARDQRARDGDALLLAAGQLGRAVVQAVADADRVDQPVEPLAVGLAPGDRERQQDVLLGVEHRQQVEGLEDEADPVAAQLRQLAVVELASARRRRCVTVPEVGRSRPARMCISVDLPDPDGPMIAAKRPLGKLDAHARERVDGDLALAVAAARSRRPRRCSLDRGWSAELRLALLITDGESSGDPETIETYPAPWT